MAIHTVVDAMLEATATSNELLSLLNYESQNTSNGKPKKEEEEKENLQAIIGDWVCHSKK